MTYLRKNAKRKKIDDPVIIESDPPNQNELPVLQNWFLEHVKTNHLRVAVFLCSGVRLDGEVVAHDGEKMLLSDGRDTQLIYLHSIVSISTGSRKLAGSKQS